MNFIGILLRVKKNARLRRLPLLVFLFLVFSFFLGSCASPGKTSASPVFPITKEERAWLAEFFRDLLFESPGAYTLFGTKPISSSCIYPPLTEQEKAELQALYDSLSDEQKASMRTPRYDFSANYQKWQEIKDRFSIRQYLFAKFSSPFREDVENVFFVNIEMTIRTLLEHYEDFRRVLGYDFDPFQIVFEIENRDSQFWNVVMGHHALQGILLGFGRDNSWFFEWEMKYKDEQNKSEEFIRSLPSAVSEDGDIIDYHPRNFMLPIFGIYGLYPNDKRFLEQIKKEREKIKKLYRGRDEVDVALEWLTR